MRNLHPTKLHQELKRNFVIERLIEKGINRSQDGLSVYDMDYEELKYELVLSAFRDKDIENENNSWF